MNKIMVYIISIIHLLMIFLNLIAIPFLIIYEPFYIWMPIITLLVSPVIGSTYCMFNRLENYFRIKAGMDIIQDRFQAFIVETKHFINILFRRN